MSISKFAKMGKGMVSIAGIYSGQLFDFSVGMGLSMLVKSINQG
jgi:hypothetical protein